MAKTTYNIFDSRAQWNSLTDKQRNDILKWAKATGKEDIVKAIKGTSIIGANDKSELYGGKLLGVYLTENKMNSWDSNTDFSNVPTSNTITESYDNLDQNFYNMINNYDQSIRDNLMLNPNDISASAYKQDMYGALDQYQATADASLAATEMSAYAMLGQQQLELENTIAEQRMKALKSGTTSAQLASQQLANMFAAQSGAAQVANNMMQTRMSNAAQFAQSRYGIAQDMYSMINANQQTYANARAQLGAIAGSYASTMNQPYAQYNAWNKLTDDQKKMVGSTWTYSG